MIKLSDPIVAEHYKSLPEGLKNAIMASGWEASMRQIAAENRLHIDQADTIGIEVMLVMIGLTDPMEFYGTIMQEAKLDAQQAEKVTLDINEKIFKHIRAELAELYEKREASGEGEEPGDDKVESREELLAEIEKPAAPGRVTLGLDRLPGSAIAPDADEAEDEEDAAGEIAEESQEANEEASIPAVPPPPAAPAPSPLFARKMEESTSSPSESKMIPMPKTGAEPKKYTVDPYREAP